MRVKITLTNTLVCYKKYSYLRITPKNFHSRLILKNSLVLKKISKNSYIFGFTILLGKFILSFLMSVLINNFKSKNILFPIFKQLKTCTESYKLFF